MLRQAVLGQLPKGFSRWDLADETGRTVAHEAVRYGCLPKDFDQWDLANNTARTVAHIAAEYNHLPKGFNQWGLADNIGWTVAHVAARFGHLPEGFSQWSIAIKDGWTVAHEAVRYGYLPKNFGHWTLSDKNGVTVAHVAAQNNHLPESFTQWALSDIDGWSVAHCAAQYNRLPANFDQWYLADNNGLTVAEALLITKNLFTEAFLNAVRRPKEDETITTEKTNSVNVRNVIESALRFEGFRTEFDKIVRGLNDYKRHLDAEMDKLTVLFEKHQLPPRDDTAELADWLMKPIQSSELKNKNNKLEESLMKKIVDRLKPKVDKLFEEIVSDRTTPPTSGESTRPPIMILEDISPATALVDRFECDHWPTWARALISLKKDLPSVTTRAFTHPSMPPLSNTTAPDQPTERIYFTSEEEAFKWIDRGAKIKQSIPFDFPESGFLYRKNPDGTISPGTSLRLRSRQCYPGYPMYPDFTTTYRR